MIQTEPLRSIGELFWKHCSCITHIYVIHRITFTKTLPRRGLLMKKRGGTPHGRVRYRDEWMILLYWYFKPEIILYCTTDLENKMPSEWGWVDQFIFSKDCWYCSSTTKYLVEVGWTLNRKCQEPINSADLIYIIRKYSLTEYSSRDEIY